MSEEEVRKILAFFAPDGKCQLKVMPMGAITEAPTFVAIMMKLYMQWDT